MPRQAEIVDINKYYRTGGIDYERLNINFDFVGVRFGQGFETDALFYEHIENLDLIQKKYFTYFVLEPDKNPEEQADFYFEAQGVSGHPVSGDIEIEGLTEYHARKFFERLKARSGPLGFDPWYYSNYNFTQKIGFPEWVRSMVKWWAEYPFDLLTKYRKFDRYLSKNPWTIPKWAIRAGYTPEFHQLTDYGDARFYLANEKTQDPVYSSGIRSCDLTVSLIDYEEALALFVPSGSGQTIEERVSWLENRVELLSEFHGL